MRFLCLYIEEVESERPSQVDWRMFVVYSEVSQFQIYGTRRKQKDDAKEKSGASSFADVNMHFPNKEEVANFIHFAFCSHNLVNYTLYEFESSALVGRKTFSTLHELRSCKKELFGYDNTQFDKTKLTSILHMLQQIGV